MEESEDSSKAGGDAPQIDSCASGRSREDGAIPSADCARAHQHCQEACCTVVNAAKDDRARMASAA